MRGLSWSTPTTPVHVNGSTTSELASASAMLTGPVRKNYSAAP